LLADLIIGGKTLQPTNKKVGRKVWRAPNKMTGALGKQPKTKVYLLKTKGPTLSTCWHSPSELREFRIELLE